MFQSPRRGRSIVIRVRMFCGKKYKLSRAIGKRMKDVWKKGGIYDRRKRTTEALQLLQKVNS